MKLKEQLQKRPRFKRALKIIGASATIFFAALGVVFSGILIGSCANQKAQEVVATTPIKHQPPIKNAMVQGENFVCSQLDYCSGIFLDNVFNNNPSLYQSGLGYYVDIPLTGNVVYYNELDFTNPYPYYHTSHGVFTYLRVIHHTNGSFGYGITYDTYTFNWCGANGTAIISYNVDCIYGVAMSNATNNFIGYACDITSVVMNQYYIVFNKTNNPLTFKYMFEENAIVNYNRGYNTGYNTGYNEGYNIGSTGLTNNPFKLITNAFTAIAGILNIQVLPNLTLGVLIFTPIIVVLIIVIVKMVRG